MLTRSEKKLYNKLAYKIRYGTKEGRKKQAERLRKWRAKKKLLTLTNNLEKTKLNK